jgi:hypothetical protein
MATLALAMFVNEHVQPPSGEECYVCYGLHKYFIKIILKLWPLVQWLDKWCGSDSLEIQ